MQAYNLTAPAEYLSNLERSGLQVRRWHVDDRNLTDETRSLCYKSWSDGDMGVFYTDTGNGALTYVDAEVTSDILVIGLAATEPDPDLVALEIDQSQCSVSGSIWMQRCNAGAKIRLSAQQGGIKTVSLFVNVKMLQDCSYPAIPSALGFALQGVPSICPELPIQIERERDHLIKAPVDLPYAHLFYRMKSSTILWLVLEYLQERDKTEGGVSPVSARTRNCGELVRRIIDENPEQWLSVNEMARRVGINRTSLRSVFKQIYGMTISEYRTTELMRRAKLMLLEFSVAETAYQLGYSSASNFSVAFKRHIGCPPDHWRKTDYNLSLPGRITSVTN